MESYLFSGTKDNEFNSMDRDSIQQRIYSS